MALFHRDSRARAISRGPISAQATEALGYTLTSASTAGREARPRVLGCQTINFALTSLQYSNCLSVP